MGNNLFDLTDKIAIITGGAGLLASEHAIALAEQGAKVILADFNEEKCNEAVFELKRQDIAAVSKY